MGLRRVARVSGLSASYLSRIEHDLVPPPSTRLIHHLARALGADVEVLLAAAGVIPEHVLELLRERPVPMARLLSVMGRMTDQEVLDVCDELRRRLERDSHRGRVTPRSS
jgi:transcriptional regulator with XRE-family HTH domain